MELIRPKHVRETDFQPFEDDRVHRQVDPSSKRGRGGEHEYLALQVRRLDHLFLLVGEARVVKGGAALENLHQPLGSAIWTRHLHRTAYLGRVAARSDRRPRNGERLRGHLAHWLALAKDDDASALAHGLPRQLQQPRVRCLRLGERLVLLQSSLWQTLCVEDLAGGIDDVAFQRHRPEDALVHARVEPLADGRQVGQRGAHGDELRSAPLQLPAHHPVGRVVVPRLRAALLLLLPTEADELGEQRLEDAATPAADLVQLVDDRHDQLGEPRLRRQALHN